MSGNSKPELRPIKAFTMTFNMHTRPTGRSVSLFSFEGELLVVLRIQTTSDCVSWACVATPDTFRIESSRPVTEWRPSKTNRGAHLALGAKNADSLRLEAWMSHLTRTRRVKRPYPPPPPPPPPPTLHNGTVGIVLFSFVLTAENIRSRQLPVPIILSLLTLFKTPTFPLPLLQWRRLIAKGDFCWPEPNSKTDPSFWNRPRCYQSYKLIYGDDFK